MFIFDNYTDDHPRTMNIKWYRGSQLLVSQDFNVTSSEYFADRPVTAYNKIVVTISNMTKPDRFLKIFSIYDGIVRDFYNEEIENLEIIEDLNVFSEEIAVNEADTTLIPNNTAGVFFQKTLPFKIYRNDTLYGSFFINSSTSNTYKTKYQIKTSDYINVLDSQSYLGGICTDITASTLIADVMGDIPYKLDSQLQNKVINGYLPICNKRDALAQIAFSIGAMVDTSRSEFIEIKKLPTTVSRTIPESEIISINTTQENITTQNVLNVLNYYQKRYAQEEELFNGRLRGTQTITFDEPKYNLVASSCTIEASGDNWCIISGNSSSASLTGKNYEKSIKTYSKQNSAVVTTDTEKTESYDTTLECDNDELVDSLPFIEYKIKSRFLMRDTRVGDLVLLNGMKARVKTLNYDLSQKDIYCDAELEAYYE